MDTEKRYFQRLQYCAILASTRSIRRWIEPREKNLSRELAALNWPPSIATIAWVNKFRFRQSATNCRKAARIGGHCLCERLRSS